MPRGFNIYDTANIANRLWTPAIIRNNLRLWLDAADLSTITADSSRIVSQWRDKSGRGNHATNATSGRRPTLRANQRNGLPALFFDNTDDGVTGNYNYSLTAESVFLCFNRLGTNGNYARYFTQSDANRDYQTTGGLIPAIRNNGSSTIEVHRAGSFVSSTAYTTGNVIYGMVVGSNLTQFKNGTAETPVAQTLNKTFTRYAIGQSVLADDIVGEVINTHYYEIITLDIAAALSLRTCIEGYLAWKWGLTTFLPASHPYRNRPPLRGD
jgi:hypothetical protein